MDVSSPIKVTHVDNWESNDDFIVPVVQEETNVAGDDYAKTSANVAISETVTTMEANMVEQECGLVDKHPGNGIESDIGPVQAPVVAIGFVPLTGAQLQQSLMIQYDSLEDIPLPPARVDLPREPINNTDSVNIVSEERVVNELYSVSDPSMSLMQEHFTDVGQAVTSSDIVLSQDQVFIDGGHILHHSPVEYVSAETVTATTVVEVPDEMAKEAAMEVPENVAYKPMSVAASKKRLSEIPVVHSVLEVKPEIAPLHQKFENVATDSISLPLPVNNGSVVDALIDLVVPVVDAASVTMPDPVSLRPQKLTTLTAKEKETLKEDSNLRSPKLTLLTVKEKEKPKQDSNLGSPKLTTLHVKEKEKSKEDSNLRPQKLAASSVKETDALKKEANSMPTLPAGIPQNLMGRSSQDPASDVGPNIPKPRPGVKVPFRNLSSQIVTKHELAKELQERSKRNFPNIDTPGGDILFTKNMTKRLANNLQAGSSKVLKEKEASIALKKKAAAKPAAVPAKPVTQRTSGDEDLLAMLEDEVDDWTIDQPPPQLVEAARSPVTMPMRNDPPKLDPAIEREIALKQLNDMPTRKPKKQLTTSKLQIPRQTKLLPAKLPAKTGPQGEVTDAQKPLRKRKIVEGVSVKTAESNGELSVAEDDAVESAAVIKAPRIFKTKKSLKLTNGVVGLAKKPRVSAAGTSTSALDKDLKGTIVNVNTVPNKSNDKTVKPMKQTKSGEETDAVTLDTPVEEVARTLVSPPRTYSSRIKKSTYSDDFVFPSTSKNRVVPVVGGNKIAKAAKSPKSPAVKAPAAVAKDVDSAPPKKRGRPKGSTKLKVIPIEAPQTPEEIESPYSPKVEKTKKTPKAKSAKKFPYQKRTEIDRLLQDEGAINMLYSVELDEEKRRTGSPIDPAPPKRVIKSTRHSHKDLLMKTRLVNSAVERLKNSPGADSPNVSLRAKRATLPATVKIEPGTTPQRKASFDSNASLQSPPSLTPMEPSSPTQVYTYPPRLRPPAEASRIIRRHSSSSNFSSRSTSPNPSRRLSMDALSPNHVDVDDVQVLSSPNAKETRKRGAPIYIRKSEALKSRKKKRNADGTVNTSVEDSVFKPRDAPIEPAKTSKATKKEAAAARVTKTPSTESGRSVGRPRRGEGPAKKAPDLTKCLAEAVTAFIAEDGNLDSSSLPPELPKETQPSSPSTPFASISYASVLRTLETDSQRRADDAARERSSPRQTVNLSTYKELSVRRHDNLVQVMIAPVSTKLINSLNPQVLHELCDVLAALRKDDSCRAVLVTSTGSSFCLGVDFHSLVVEKPDKRKAVAQEFALAVKQFVTSLSQFNKPIVAGVHGAAVGLGVTMLPFFDMVFASDKATFYTPYARLGQAPEGAAVVTLPQLLGNAVTSELLYSCRKLTATEALQYGLVTRILWPERFQEELLPLIRTLASQSSQSMEATKALLRFNLRSRVESALEAESLLLVQHWSSAECQANFKRFLDDEDIGLQRQRVDA